jgi:hypothetical protein
MAKYRVSHDDTGHVSEHNSLYEAMQKVRDTPKTSVHEITSASKPRHIAFHAGGHVKATEQAHPNEKSAVDDVPRVGGPIKSTVKAKRAPSMASKQKAADAAARTASMASQGTKYLRNSDPDHARAQAHAGAADHNAKAASAFRAVGAHALADRHEAAAKEHAATATSIGGEQFGSRMKNTIDDMHTEKARHAMEAQKKVPGAKKAALSKLGKVAAFKPAGPVPVNEEPGMVARHADLFKRVNARLTSEGKPAQSMPQFLATGLPPGSGAGSKMSPPKTEPIQRDWKGDEIRKPIPEHLRESTASIRSGIKTARKAADADLDNRLHQASNAARVKGEAAEMRGATPMDHAAAAKAHKEAAQLAEHHADMMPNGRGKDLMKTHKDAAAHHEEKAAKGAINEHFARIVSRGFGNRDAGDASRGARVASEMAENFKGTPRYQKQAGEFHLNAAKLHDAVGNTKEAAAHRDTAAEHAKAAGGEWDEAKHPRDKDGKFGG